ncbi:unnamed protein product [Ilex paraguariensis]|uniref:Uncharacterized protein n=1 Tax=Ilex paraguariensis TaxID=185542 RepID=A0ABC8RAE9_9AQUA
MAQQVATMGCHGCRVLVRLTAEGRARWGQHAWAPVVGVELWQLQDNPVGHRGRGWLWSDHGGINALGCWARVDERKKGVDRYKAWPGRHAGSNSGR